ncbi:hypothetical protein Slin14017_G015610 [Septoria linicola]|nr:hypothetical protein Slin14017_G015610 [Septoria linicola]
MPFWSTLTNEIQALREGLEDDEDEEHQSFESGPSTAAATDAVTHADLLIVPPASIYVMPEALLEPVGEMESTLYQIYFADIDAVFKVLHKPSIQPLLEFGDTYLDQTADSPSNTALRAAMWFSSVTSLSESDRRSDKPRSELLRLSRRHCDFALSKADLINTTDLATLQAAVIYIAASRLTDPSRRPWTSTALVARIAQGVGLQHEQPNHTPFEKELRRRL